MPTEERVKTSWLFAWKYAECPACPFIAPCEQSCDNLRVCFEEDRDSFKGRPFAYLVKGALRRLIIRQRRRRLSPSSSSHSSTLLRTVTKVEPRAYTATLICSDREEYLACLHST